jgi:hypothetical protein
MMDFFNEYAFVLLVGFIALFVWGFVIYIIRDERLELAEKKRKKKKKR